MGESHATTMENEMETGTMELFTGIWASSYEASYPKEGRNL